MNREERVKQISELRKRAASRAALLHELGLVENLIQAWVTRNIHTMTLQIHEGGQAAVEFMCVRNPLTKGDTDSQQALIDARREHLLPMLSEALETYRSELCVELDLLPTPIEAPPEADPLPPIQLQPGDAPIGRGR